MQKSLQLLIIGFVLPEPNSSAAGNRMMQLINLFKENNYKITFASTSFFKGKFCFVPKALFLAIVS